MHFSANPILAQNGVLQTPQTPPRAPQGPRSPKSSITIPVEMIDPKNQTFEGGYFCQFFTQNSHEFQTHENKDIPSRKLESPTTLEPFQELLATMLM